MCDFIHGNIIKRRFIARTTYTNTIFLWSSRTRANGGGGDDGYDNGNQRWWQLGTAHVFWCADWNANRIYLYLWNKWIIFMVPCDVRKWTSCSFGGYRCRHCEPQHRVQSMRQNSISSCRYRWEMRPMAVHSLRFMLSQPLLMMRSTLYGAEKKPKNENKNEM